MPCHCSYTERPTYVINACQQGMKTVEERRAHSSVKVVPKMPMRLSTRKWRNVGTAARTVECRLTLARMPRLSRELVARECKP